jgi:hypothetical protein
LHTINQPPEWITYWQCKDGSFVKVVDYRADDGEFFTYVEFRDRHNQLTGSRFSRAPNVTAADVPLADSDTRDMTRRFDHIDRAKELVTEAEHIVWLARDQRAREAIIHLVMALREMLEAMQ